jgi:predicted DNA-binding WGR domain protein
VPEKNQQRFYLLRLAPTLFGEWSLIREWARIGQQGRIVLDIDHQHPPAALNLEASPPAEEQLGSSDA